MGQASKSMEDAHEVKLCEQWVLLSLLISSGGRLLACSTLEPHSYVRLACH